MFLPHSKDAKISLFSSSPTPKTVTQPVNTYKALRKTSGLYNHMSHWKAVRVDSLYYYYVTSSGKDLSRDRVSLFGVYREMMLDG